MHTVNARVAVSVQAMVPSRRMVLICSHFLQEAHSISSSSLQWNSSTAHMLLLLHLVMTNHSIGG